MSESAAGLTPPSSTAQRLTVVGFGFIALAFTGPFIAARVGFGGISASGAWEDIPKTLVVLLLLAFLAWAEVVESEGEPTSRETACAGAPRQAASCLCSPAEL